VKTATALSIAAIGAIFAFAVTAEPSFFNFHAAGWVLMVTGIAGSVAPRRSYGWLRRRLVLNTDGTERKEVDIRQQHFAKSLVPGGLITQGRDAGRDSSDHAPVESDTIEQFIEE
jgi:hypothetical protein